MVIFWMFELRSCYIQLFTATVQILLSAQFGRRLQQSTLWFWILTSTCSSARKTNYYGILHSSSTTIEDFDQTENQRNDETLLHPFTQFMHTRFTGLSLHCLAAFHLRSNPSHCAANINCLFVLQTYWKVAKHFSTFVRTPQQFTIEFQFEHAKIGRFRGNEPDERYLRKSCDKTHTYTISLYRGRYGRQQIPKK